MTNILKFQSPADKQQEIWSIAESWLGTPFVWQASVKGQGCDCKGLITGIAREAELPEAKHPYFSKADYAKVDTSFLRKAMVDCFVQVRKPQKGDVALVVFGGKAQHLAICDGDGSIIHCYNRLNSVVVKQQIRHWQIDSFWTWESLNGN